jgi:hypothetical protein
MHAIRFVCSLALPTGIFLGSILLLGSLNGASAQGSDAAREACTPDAMRLCNEFVPDEGKVRSCMLSKRSQLSEACRLIMRVGPKEGLAVPREGARHHRHHHNE